MMRWWRQQRLGHCFQPGGSLQRLLRALTGQRLHEAEVVESGPGLAGPSFECPPGDSIRSDREEHIWGQTTPFGGPPRAPRTSFIGAPTSQLVHFGPSFFQHRRRSDVLVPSRRLLRRGPWGGRGLVAIARMAGHRKRGPPWAALARATAPPAALLRDIERCVDGAPEHFGGERAMDDVLGPCIPGLSAVCCPASTALLQAGTRARLTVSRKNPRRHRAPLRLFQPQPAQTAWQPWHSGIYFSAPLPTPPMRPARLMRAGVSPPSPPGRPNRRVTTGVGPIAPALARWFEVSLSSPVWGHRKRRPQGAALARAQRRLRRSSRATSGAPQCHGRRPRPRQARRPPCGLLSGVRDAELVRNSRSQLAKARH